MRSIPLLLFLFWRHLHRRVRLRNIFVSLAILFHHLLPLSSLRKRRHLFLPCLYGIKTLFLQIDAKQCLEVVPLNPQDWIAHQALVDQLVQYPKLLHDFHSSLLGELFAVCAEGMKLVQHFMQNDSNRPDIAFNRIRSSFGLAEVHFRSHRVRRPASPAFYLKLLPHELSQAEISQLDLAFLHQDVLKLEVAVQDVPGLQHVHPVNDLLEVLEHSF